MRLRVRIYASASWIPHGPMGMAATGSSLPISRQNVRSVWFHSPGERVLAVRAHPAKLGLKRRFMPSERLQTSLSEKLRNLRRLGA